MLYFDSSQVVNATVKETRRDAHVTNARNSHMTSAGPRTSDVYHVTAMPRGLSMVC